MCAGAIIVAIGRKRSNNADKPVGLAERRLLLNQLGAGGSVRAAAMLGSETGGRSGNRRYTIQTKQDRVY